MPYYAVQNGKSNGVYSDWDSCKSQVNGYSGAVYKKFNSASEAQTFANSSGGYSGSAYGSTSSRSTSSGSTSCRSGSYGSGSSSSGQQSIYTDGASRGNGRSSNPPSGYGVYYGNNHPKNAAVPMLSVDGGNNPATNQRAELAGLRHALRDVLSSKRDGLKYTIKSDSKYALDSINKWLNNWEQNGYKIANNKPVQNQDLIKECVDLRKDIQSSHASTGRGGLSFEHVKGHQGNYGNEQADRLANLGADRDTK